MEKGLTAQNAAEESIRMLEEFIYRDKNDIRRQKTERKIEFLRKRMEEED